MGAVSGEAMAQIVHKELYGNRGTDTLNQSEKETLRAIATLASGLVGAAQGGSFETAATAAAAGYNAVTNNYLTDKQIWAYAKALKEHCHTGQESACIAVKNTFSALDAAQRTSQVEACKATPQSKSCADHNGGAQSGDWAVNTNADNYLGVDSSKPGKEALHIMCGNNRVCMEEITRQDLRNNLDQLIVERDPVFIRNKADEYRNGLLGSRLDFRGMSDQEVINHAREFAMSAAGIMGSTSKLGAQWKQNTTDQWYNPKDGRYVNSPDTLNTSLYRPTLNATTKQAIDSRYRQLPNGDYIEIETRTVIKQPVDYGHIYGWENRRLLKAADELGMTQQQFKAYVNARPNLFELQNRKDNQGHKFEKPGVDGLDDIRKDMRNFMKGIK